MEQNIMEQLELLTSENARLMNEITDCKALLAITYRAVENIATLMVMRESDTKPAMHIVSLNK